MFGVWLGRFVGSRIEPSDLAADDSVGSKRKTDAAWEPNVGSYRAAAIHECTDWNSAADVQQRRIAALVRLKIDFAKRDTLVTLVIVDSEVGEKRISAAENLTVYEGRGKRAVAVPTSDVIRAELGGLNVLNQEPQGRMSAHNAGAEDGAVLVVVPGKQVAHDSIVVPRRHKDVAFG